ncbi:MAG: sugar ABC transporter ATP-binding protein [Thermomicrobiales bacterium]
MSEPAVTIRLRDVAKSFGQTRALRACHLEARAGEVHAIVGENGSGKSTLAKIISGVLLFDQGTVDILGRTPSNPIEMRDAGVATIFQEVLVADEASVYDNLYVGRDGLFTAGAGRTEREAKASELLERFIGAKVDLDAQVGSLPLSTKQWIVIARAILRRPKILILDESSAALDLDATVRLHTEISRLRAEGTTILIVTHRIAELVRIADRATVLRDGETVGTIDKADITEANLLSMMTPADRHVSAGGAFPVRSRSTGGAPVLSTEGLTLGGSSAPFSFQLQAGEIVGVTGLDGQGQDAFLRVLAGIDLPASGVPVAQGAQRIVVSGLAAAEAAGITYVSGDRKREGIFPDQSIFENLAIGVYSSRLGPLGIIRRQGLQAAFQKEVDRLRIKIGQPFNKITSLSGGNQQKVLIGRAFARNPRVIVLNDPARGVDLSTKRDLYAELRRFADEGGAVVYLSSEIEEFIGFADRVDVFFANRIFRSLSGHSISEHEILAAMFGQERAAELTFGQAESAA